MSDTILDVRDLSVQFQSASSMDRANVVKAVDGISFQVKKGQTLGIVGESGSGKSVTSLAVMGLVPCPPGKLTSGELWFYPATQQRSNGQASGSVNQGATKVDLRKLPLRTLQQYRGDKISMIFQEPMSSLNPVYTCGYQLVEAIQQHETISKAEAQQRAIALFQEVKLLPSDAILQEECIGAWRLKNGRLTNSELENSELQNGELQNGELQNNETPKLEPPADEVSAYVNRRKRAMFDRFPHELSGGQLQRVMIAMAICCNPSLLIADEPTTALDVTVQAMILDLLRELRDRRGMAMMFITHDLSIIAEIADTVAVMYKGKIVETGSVDQIFADPQNAYTKGLLTCRPRPEQRLKCLPTVADFMDVSQTSNGETIIKEKERSIEDVLTLNTCVSADEMESRLTQLKAQKPLLSIKNLQVGFPVKGVLGQLERYVMAVNGVSFEVFPGETLGLVGESGCGKSTLAATLLQLIKPMGGQVIFDGHDITQMGRRELRALRKEMQIIFQDPFSSLDPRMSVGKAIAEPLQIHREGGNRRQRRVRVGELMDRVGLDPNCIDRFPHEFSGGQRQRVCIARALALRPKFIICDESVSALDVSVQAQVLNLLKGLQEEFGLTYIFISHDLSVVKFMSDRIMVMNQGKIEEIGPADEIYDHPQKAYTKDLIAAIPKGTLEQIEHRQTERKNALKVS
ncbi:MAG: ABC transporter ATP-binding protein [Cyanobacteria bacterium P01_F01_bin.150]